MTRYKNLGRNSGVVAYEIEVDSITVEFHDRAVYIYTYTSAGTANIEKMKSLAIAGRGLNAFINKHVKKRYAARLR